MILHRSNRARSSKFGKTFTSRRGGRAAAERAALEPLESRMLMSGTTILTANNLGAVSTSAAVKANGTVSNSTPDEFYKFTLTSIRDVTASLGNQSGNASLFLINDANNNGIIDSGEDLIDSGGGAIHQRLAAGTYFVRVNQSNSASTSYTVTVTAPTAAADPGNDIFSAKDLGAVGTSGAVTNADWVGNFDANDFYKFSISSIRDVTVALGNQTNNASLFLIRDANNNGVIDSGEDLIDSGGGAIHQRLAAGTYFVQVNQSNSRDTFYTLSVSAPSAAADPGGDIFDAKSLGAVGTSGSVSNADWVGNADPEDFYSFSISSIRDVTVSLGNQTNNASLFLIRDANNNGVIDSGEDLIDSGGGAIHQRLAAGTYFVRVNQSNSRDTFYTLSVSAASAAADPGNDILDSKDLGAVGTGNAVTNADWVGNADPEDFYKFSISSIRDVTVALGNQTNNASLFLIRDANSNGVIDNGEDLIDSGGSAIHQRLDAGTYFVRVNQSNSRDTFYTLSVSAPAASADPGNTIAAAFDFGAVSGTTTLKDWVGNADTDDFYKFTLPTSGAVSVSLGDQTNNASLFLIHDVNKNGIIDNGEVLASSGGSVLQQTLTAGTYYVQVNQSNSRDTFYTLSLVTPVVSLPTVSIAATDATATEPATSSATATDTGLYTISRTGATTSALTVNLTISGTATNGTDYTKINSSVVIPTGAASVTIKLTPKFDSLAEPTETAIVTIAGGGIYTISTSKKSATVNILNAGAPGTISGTVFTDTNANAKQDSGETGKSGVVVYNDTNNDGKLETGEVSTTTSSTGAYSFTGLAAGSYIIREVVPTGFTQTTPTSNAGFHLTLAAGQTISGNLFGVHTSSTATGSIAGTVFNDANANKAFDAAELGLGLWQVYIDTNNNGKLDTGETSVTTDADGKFSFTKLAAGTYILRVVQRTGTAITTSASVSVTLTSGLAATGKLFGEKRIA